jgi:phage terminase small subunit
MLRFCSEYRKDLNGTEAVIRAGYKVSSRKAASVQAVRLLGNARIQAYLGELAELTDIGLLSELAAIGMARFSDCLDENGDIQTDLSQVSDRARAAVKSVTKSTRVTKEGDVIETVTITMHDKLAALDKLVRIFRINSEAPVTPVSDDVDMNSLTDKQLERLANGEPLESVMA